MAVQSMMERTVVSDGLKLKRVCEYQAHLGTRNAAIILVLSRKYAPGKRTNSAQCC